MSVCDSLGQLLPSVLSPHLLRSCLVVFSAVSHQLRDLMMLFSPFHPQTLKKKKDEERLDGLESLWDVCFLRLL